MTDTTLLLLGITAYTNWDLDGGPTRTPRVARWKAVGLGV